MSLAHNRFDVIIIGAGPAGLSAAAWCSELGMSVVMIDREAGIGGQLRMIYNPIENHLGLRAANGAEMIANFERSIDRADVSRMMSCEVARIDSEAKSVITADGTELSWRALIIATGVRRRSLNIPGEIEYRGRGIIESGARDRESLEGKRVLVVGGGDAALENALILSDFASSVKVAFRKAAPTARMLFQSAAGKRSNVSLLPRTIVRRIIGDSTVSAVELTSNPSDETLVEAVDAVLIRIGVQPNSDFFEGIVDLDNRGYIKIDADGRTSRTGVFAIGDVAYPAAPTISTAVGSGATAAKSAFRFLSGEMDV